MDELVLNNLPPSPFHLTYHKQSVEPCLFPTASVCFKWKWCRLETQTPSGAHCLKSWEVLRHPCSAAYSGPTWIIGEKPHVVNWAGCVGHRMALLVWAKKTWSLSSILVTWTRNGPSQILTHQLSDSWLMGSFLCWQLMELLRVKIPG